tara:strand:+ start:166 stop:1476 length:1311 start_codon:yes stop_codon:yes gene_type:complete
MPNEFNQAAFDEKMGELVGAVTAAQEQATAGKADYDANIVAAGELAAKAGEAMQQMQQKQKGLEESQAFLEKQIARVGDGESGGEKANQIALHSKMDQEISRYLRTGTEVTADILDEMHKDMTERSLFGASQQEKEAHAKALSAGSNADGGYWIMPQRAAMTIQRIFETSPMRLIANIMNTTSDSVEIIIDDDEMTSGGWVGETSPRSETGTAKIGKLTIPVHEQFSQPKATQKMLDDAGFDVESWVARKVADKMTRTENTAFIAGDGSQKPRGILDLAAWDTAGTYQRNALERVNSGTSGAFTGDGLKTLQNSVIEAYQANAVWAMKRASFTGITTLKDSNGAYLLNPRSLAEGDELRLLGKRVMFMDDIPAVGAGSESLIYGDFNQGYSIVDRIGFRVIRDNVTLKPYILFYTTKRTGGDVTNFEALKVQKLSV